MKFFKIAVLALASLALFGCNSSDDDNVMMITLHSGNSRSIDSELSRRSVTMPQSGMTVMMDKSQFIYNGDLEEVHFAKNPMPDGSMINGFYLVTNDRGAKRLMQATGGNIGSFIVLCVNGEPKGLRKIDTVIQDGKIFMISEFDGTDEEMSDYVAEMNDAIKKVGKKIEEDNKF